MASTVERMQRGVHSKDACGSNLGGFSAVNSIPGTSNFHMLNDTLFSSGIVPSTVRPKFNMLSSDVLAYTLAKVFLRDTKYDNYVLLLREGMHLAPCVKSMILSYSYDTLIIIVRPASDSYIATSYYKTNVSTVPLRSTSYLNRFIGSMNSGRYSMYIAYPELTAVYMNLLNSLDQCSWYIPCSRRNVYVSELGRQYYDFFAFPWSGSHHSRGYVVGSGKVRPASNRESSLYVGSFGYYDSLMSCVPYRGSCIDCHEMKRTAMQICQLIGYKHTPESPPVIRPKSLEVLDDLNELMKSYISQ